MVFKAARRLEGHDAAGQWNADEKERNSSNDPLFPATFTPLDRQSIRSLLRDLRLHAEGKIAP
jgi:hypothetical protein